MVAQLEAHKSSEGLKEQILQAAHEADQIMHLRLEKGSVCVYSLKTVNDEGERLMLQVASYTVFNLI